MKDGVIERRRDLPPTVSFPKYPQWPVQDQAKPGAGNFGVISHMRAVAQGFGPSSPAGTWIGGETAGPHVGHELSNLWESSTMQQRLSVLALGADTSD